MAVPRRLHRRPSWREPVHLARAPFEERLAPVDGDEVCAWVRQLSCGDVERAQEGPPAKIGSWGAEGTRRSEAREGRRGRARARHQTGPRRRGGGHVLAHIVWQIPLARVLHACMQASRDRRLAHMSGRSHSRVYCHCPVAASRWMKQLAMPWYLTKRPVGAPAKDGRPRDQVGRTDGRTEGPWGDRKRTRRRAPNASDQPECVAVSTYGIVVWSRGVR